MTAVSLDLSKLSLRDLSKLRRSINHEIEVRERRQKIDDMVRRFPRHCLIRTHRGDVGRVLAQDPYDGITLIIEVRGEIAFANVWGNWDDPTVLAFDGPEADATIDTALPTAAPTTPSLSDHLAHVRDGFAQPIDQAQLAEIQAKGAAAEAERGARIMAQMKGGR